MYSHAFKPVEARAVVKRGLEASEMLYVDRIRETVRFDLEKETPPLVITHMRHHALVVASLMKQYLANGEPQPQLKEFVLAAFVQMLTRVVPHLTFASPDDFKGFVGAIAKEVTVINSRSVVIEYSRSTRKITKFYEGPVPQPQYE
jgi:hypothetical protein